MKSAIFVLMFLVPERAVHSDPGCGVIPMTQWAGEASSWATPLTNPVNMAIIQHTVTPEGASDEECVKLLKAIRKYHKETLGFDDIGESFLICATGKVYEGAGWSLVGAHTKTYNSKSIGIGIMGDFGTHPPTAEAMKAAKDLIACGVRDNHLTSDYELVGHRQVSDTMSPGDALQKEIETWPQWTGAP